MIYLLDTDHCSVLQRGGLGYDALADRLSNTALDDYGTTIITYEEQCRGWTDRINRADTPSARVEAYGQLQENLRFYTGLAVWEYTPEADHKCSELIRAKVRVGTKDLRIAAIALTVNAVVLTRNTRDFSRVPGLIIQDWTL